MTATTRSSRTKNLRLALKDIYFRSGRGRMGWRLAILALDILVIAFFIAAPAIKGEPWYLTVDYIVAGLVALDLAARAWAYGDVKRFLSKPLVWVDLFVLATLLLPTVFGNFGFLRVLRLWTLTQQGFVFRALKGVLPVSPRTQQVSKDVTTLVTFIFVMTGFVYATYAGSHEKIQDYIDALYFTVTTLTTTGFGDITLPGDGGQLLSIFMMLTGFGLFLRLVQSVFRPYKVDHECHKCGLVRHEADAQHCKACGVVLNIPN